MKYAWVCWRIIESQKATYTEVVEKMNIVDVMKLHDTIDVMNDARNRYQKMIDKT